LVLRHFTVVELSAYAGIDVQAVLDFLSDSVDLVDRPLGHSSDQWRVRREAIARLRESTFEWEEAVTSVPAGDAPQLPAIPGVGNRVDDPDGDAEDWLALARGVVEDIEADIAAHVGHDPLTPKDAQKHALVDHTKSASQTRGLGAASMYLARCESTLWICQCRHTRQQSLHLTQVRKLRARIGALGADEASASARTVEATVQQSLQDWSESLPHVLFALEVRVPTILQTLREGDLACWVAGDLGISSPWFQAAARAIALREADRPRWPEVYAHLVAHCSQVLCLPSCGPALSSIGALAATLEAGELALPLLSALLMLDSASAAGSEALPTDDRRVVYMALCRLAQAPTPQSRVRRDVAFACELLLSQSDGGKEFELLAPAALLRDMLDGYPWLDRALHPSAIASVTFDRNLVRAIFLAARDPEARASLSAALVTPAGLSLVNRLHDRGVAHRTDDANSHLLIPCDSIYQSMVNSRHAGDLMLDMLRLPRLHHPRDSESTAIGRPASTDERDVLRLPLPIPQDSEEFIQMSVVRSQEVWEEAKSGSSMGAFSEGVRTRSVPGYLLASIEAGEGVP
jgi:hypothetical protein